MHPHHGVVRLAVLFVLLVRPDCCCDHSRLAVGAAGHQRRDCGCCAAARIGVVSDAVGHQVGAEVGVAEAELTEGAGVVANLLGRVARWRDDDLLGEQQHVGCVLEVLDVECAVWATELHQVDRGKVAGRIIDVHVLRAWVGCVDPARVRRRVPLVDRRVVLNARVGAAPCGAGDLHHQFARGH